VAAVDGRIRLRESDDPGVVVNSTQYRLKALILAVKAGEFDDLG
jgi:hypothetical protein